MTTFEQWCRACPVATLSTAVFYAVAIYFLVAAAHRRRVFALFAPAVPSTRAYSGALDAYRGLAAAMVAFAHMLFWCYPVFWASKDVSPHLISYGGNKAVPVFVLLSGFLIYRSVRQLKTGDDVRDYASRRLLRIYPLYLVSAVLVFATGQIAAKPRTVVPEVLMFRVFDYPTFGNPAAWSLYVEMCFYVFLPVFVLAAGRWAAWASAAAFATLAVADPAGPREMYLWKFFFLGILVSHLSDGLTARLRRPAAREVVGLGLFALGLYTLYYDLGGRDADWVSALTKIPHNTAENTIGLGIGFGLVVAGTMCSAVVSRVAGVAPLRFLGTISYSVFLIHPFYILANFPELKFASVGRPQDFFTALGTAPWWYGFFVFAPGLIVWASVSYALIERPFLLMRPKPARPEAGGILPFPPPVPAPEVRQAA
jgi:peptidoglycan/LPS O-acetylase OafA/YrhL